MSQQPPFKTLNRIIENYYDPKHGLIEVEKFIRVLKRNHYLY